MSISERFTQVLHGWAETFMQRSMHDFIQYSRESGLSVSQLSTLFRLHHCSVCSVSELGDHLGITNAAASQLVDRLVNQGLLERTEDPKDRRGKQLKLSPRGRAVVQGSIEARWRWMEALNKTLSPEEQEFIIQGLEILTENAQRLENEGIERA
jgi:DNA-binding MarR family transcriptional regulator